jgi:hypothetical protein
MTTAAIEYIWKAIQESERSDELQFMDAEARWMPSARSDTPGRESITAVGADPLQTNGDPLPAVTGPVL